MTQYMGIIRVAAGVVVGGLLGYALYKFVGCKSGACPITAHAWSSILYGAVLGVAFTAWK